jgi:hypothetical protein
LAVTGASLGFVAGAIAGLPKGPVFGIVTAVASAIITGIAIEKVAQAGVATAGAIKVGKKEADYEGLMQISSPLK